MVTASQTFVDIKKVFSIKTSKIEKQDSNIFQALLWDILHYVKLEKSDFNVAIIRVGVHDVLNCHGDIDQINNIFRNIKHIVNKCRQHHVTNILLSGLTTTDRLPRELIKNFKILIRNIYIVQHQIMVLQIKQIPR